MGPGECAVEASRVMSFEPGELQPQMPYEVLQCFFKVVIFQPQFGWS